jgi:hypothetical protein
MTATGQTDLPPLDDEPQVEDPRRPSILRRIWYAIAGLIVIGSFGTWAYVYFIYLTTEPEDRPPPDLLADASFGQRAEEICDGAWTDIQRMPGAIDAVDGADRGRQIEVTTVRLEEMLDDLDQLVGGDARDVEISTGWLADWRVLIQDRYDYAAAIAVDDNAQFYVSDVGVSERLDRRITRLATTNRMPSCSAPDDVG